MLVLTRKMDQVIKLGDDITITVVRMSNGSVQLGVEAPQSLKIMRAERHDLLRAESRDVLRADSHDINHARSTEQKVA